MIYKKHNKYFGMSTVILLVVSGIIGYTSSADASVWTSEQSTTSGVDVTVNWSNAGNQGQYKICYDTDNTPCTGSSSTEVLTTNKPAVLNLSACTSYRIKAKILRRFWRLTAWDSQGVVSITTGPISGGNCSGGTPSTPTPPAIVSNADQNSIALTTTTFSPTTEIRSCIRSLSASNPILHPELCEREDWAEVLNGFDVIVPGQVELGHNEGYNEQSQRIAAAKRITSPHPTLNSITFTNLHSKCNYKLITLFYSGQAAPHPDLRVIKTGGGGGVFGGWSCFFGSVGNSWFGMTLSNDDDVSELLRNNDNAKLAYAFLTSNNAAVELTQTYTDRVQELYIENPKLEIEHAELAEKFGFGNSQSQAINDDKSELHESNFLLAEMLIIPAFFEIWQKSLEERDLSFQQYLSSIDSQVVDGYVKEILSDSSWENIEIPKKDDENSREKQAK